MQSSSEVTAAMFQLDSEAHSPSAGNPVQFSQELNHDARSWGNFGQWNKDGQRAAGVSIRDMKPEDDASKKSLIG